MVLWLRLNEWAAPESRYRTFGGLQLCPSPLQFSALSKLHCAGLIRQVSWLQLLTYGRTQEHDSSEVKPQFLTLFIL